MDAALASAIRAELRAFVDGAGTRRALGTTIHVGHPGGEHARWPHDVTANHAMRTDLVERAVDGLRVIDGACAWVTRGGELEVTDADAEWFAAARTAFSRHGLQLPVFFVLNRSGWVDLVSGERRAWSRVRRSASLKAR